MPSPPLLALRDASVTFGGRPTFAGVSVALGAGDRACLVGRNGSGKSTLLKAMAGLIEIDHGTRFHQPGARIAYTPQWPVFDRASTAAAFVDAGLSPDATQTDRRYRVAAVLDEVGVSPTRLLADLSGGESRRVSLAQALVDDPDILLLDEPTNHLDIPAVEWLEERLAAHRAGLLIISHDRAFLKRLSHRTLWLDRGALRELDQGYAAFEDWSEAILATEAATDARLDKRIASETIWSRQGISARRRRNQGRLARLVAMRQERAQRVNSGKVKLGAVSAESGGRLVIEAEGIAKAFESPAGPKVIVRNFSTRILRGDRVGLIGRNGAGKTTLLGMLTGAIAPDSGTVRHGTNLMPAVLDQHRAALDPNRSLWETLTEGGGDTIFVQQQPCHVASYLKDFLFEERQFRAPVSTLSGGERNRLLLAKVLAQPSNLLILDEPTNDLDIETLDLVEEVLAEYDGTLLLVSHDRDFLDRLVSSIIAVEGDGVIHEYVGGYTDYLRQRTPPPPPKPAAKPAERATAAPRERAPSRLSYKEQRELESLPQRIAELEAEKAAIEQALAEPDRFAGDHAALAASAARHHAVIAELTAAEERWLMLAEQQERLARGNG